MRILSEYEKCEWREKAIPRRFTKVSVINESDSCVIALLVFLTTFSRYWKEWSSTKGIFFSNLSFRQQNDLPNMINGNTLLIKTKGLVVYFMELSKTFDALNYNLLINKVNGYGFFFSAIKFVQSYLSERFQRVNINDNFSEWCKILLGVPQGSILSSFSFNIFINDIFYFIQEAYICNFTDDNSLYSIENIFKEVKTILCTNASIKCIANHQCIY